MSYNGLDRNAHFPPARPAMNLRNRFTAFGCLFVFHFSLVTAAESVSEKTGGESVAAGHSYHGEAFNEGPRQAAWLLDGMAEIQFPVTSKSKKAQEFVRQGISQIHGFWYLEAERSFRQAAKEDPKLAIAYWGMAMANVNNGDRSRGFIDEAMKWRTKNGTSRHEKLYIEALERFIPKAKKKDDDDDDKKEKTDKQKEAERDAKKSRAERYVADLEKILYDFPDDIEARAFIAVHLWQSERIGVKLTSRYAVNALLGEVFAKNPNHPAHHYRIHLWDSRRPENALVSAAECGPAAPGIAHMWHMPGHIYSKLKRYNDAAWQQEASARVDHAHMVRSHLIPDQIHNYAHNNEWLTRNLLYVGRVNEALDQSRNLVSNPRHPKYNTLKKRGSYQYGRDRLIQTLSQYGLWKELIMESGGHYLPPTGNETAQEEWLSWLAVAKFMTGDTEEAGKTLRSLKRRRIALQTKLLDLADGKDVSLDDKESEKDDDDEDESEEKADTEEIKKKLQTHLKSINKAIHRASVASAAKRKDLTTFRRQIKSAGLEKTIQQEWLAMAGDLDGAIKECEKTVKSSKGQVRPLALLVHLLWEKKDKTNAKKRFEELRTLAGHADIETPMLARLRPVADAVKAGKDWRKPAKPADDLGERPELDELGPFRWSPYEAPAWEAKSAEGEAVPSTEYDGKPRVVVFYLGHGCLHCVEQLHVFEPRAKEFRDAGIDMLAISTEDVKELTAALKGYDKKLTIPLLAGSDQKAFRAFQCWDDFEDQPLHGTFLIDAQNRVRWQDIGHEPFNDVDFLLDESNRLLALPKQ